jgi:hypothetical protein
MFDRWSKEETVLRKTFLRKSLICLLTGAAAALLLVVLSSPASAEEATANAQLDPISQEEMADLWGGAAKKCYKCGTTRKKCPAQGPADCNCVSVTVWGFTINKCGLGCPAGTGYLECEYTGKKEDTCDPNKKTAKHCKGYSWDWAGPGNPATCPANFDCTTNPGAGGPDTNDGYHNSCG